jgi:hypothetical protein
MRYPPNVIGQTHGNAAIMLLRTRASRTTCSTADLKRAAKGKIQAQNPDQHVPCADEPDRHPLPAETDDDGRPQPPPWLLSTGDPVVGRPSSSSRSPFIPFLILLMGGDRPESAASTR